MIEKDKILKRYSGSSPIFPLPNVVMFPNVGNEFYIFEPRYKEMIKDVIENEKFVTITLLKPGYKKNYENSPKINQIGTLCYLTDYKSQSDGNYKIVLFGIDKVKINEAEQTKKYRIAATSSIKEIISAADEKEKCKVLVKRFANLTNQFNKNMKIDFLSDINIKLEVLVNLISMAINIPTEEKQKLLELPEIGLRYEILLHFIDNEISSSKDLLENIPYIPYDDSIN